jgi:hypothetical protein
MCLLGVSTLRNYIWDSYSKKLPQFLTGIGIPSLNVQSNNFRIASPILVIRSSNDASPQKNSTMQAKLLKVAFGELLSKNCPKGSFPTNISIL